MSDYNGWKNCETWAMNLWMRNDSDRYWSGVAQDAWDNADDDTEREMNAFTRDERAALALADTMKEQHDEAMPELTGVWADLLDGAFGEIYWMDIARNWLTDVDRSESEVA